MIELPKCYLVSLNVENRICLVGGGKVAERKVHSLLDRGALVRLISPAITKGINSLAQQGKVEYIRDNYRKTHLEKAFLVIGATDEEEVNARVSADCMERGILVNVVDDPPRGNFYVPAVVQRGPLQIAVSTDGKSPMLARKIRERLETIFPAEFEEVVEFIGELREKVIKETGDPLEKERILTALLEQSILELLWAGKYDLAKERITNACICSGSKSQDSPC